MSSNFFHSPIRSYTYTSENVIHFQTTFRLRINSQNSYLLLPKELKQSIKRVEEESPILLTLLWRESAVSIMTITLKLTPNTLRLYVSFAILCITYVPTIAKSPACVMGVEKWRLNIRSYCKSGEYSPFPQKYLLNIWT